MNYCLLLIYMILNSSGFLLSLHIQMLVFASSSTGLLFLLGLISSCGNKYHLYSQESKIYNFGPASSFELEIHIAIYSNSYIPTAYSRFPLGFFIDITHLTYLKLTLISLNLLYYQPFLPL